MSHICGYPTASGAWCTQMVSDPMQPNCGRHKTSMPQQKPVPDKRGCVIRQIEPNKWRCETHTGAQWEAAEALGADSPCRLPLAPLQKVALAAQPELDMATVRLLLKGATDKVKLELAQNVDCPPPVLVALLSEKAPAVAHRAMCNPSLPNEVRESLLQNPANAHIVGTWKYASADAFVRMARGLPETSGLFKERNIPAAALEELANINERTELRVEVAGCVCTPPRLLDAMSRDPLLEVRAAVAKNPNTPADTLMRLSKGPGTAVLVGLAGNPHTPAPVLQRLVDSVASAGEYELRDQIVHNPSTSTELLHQLANDPTCMEAIQQAAQKRLNERRRERRQISA